MASKPRPNKSFLLRLGNLPDEVRQAAKDRTSPVKQPKFEFDLPSEPEDFDDIEEIFLEEEIKSTETTYSNEDSESGIYF